MARKNTRAAAAATPPATGRALLDYRAVSDLTGMSERFIRDEVRAGKLQPIRLGASIRFRPAEVERYLDAHTESR